MSELPLEPQDEPTDPDAPAAPDGDDGDGPPTSDTPPKEAIPLEPHPDDEDDLDQAPCTNCGAPVPVGDSICVRCGFDVAEDAPRAGDPHATPAPASAAADDSVDDDADDESVEGPPEVKPLTPAGGGGLRLPLIIAGVSAAVMIVAYLAGARGLFPLGEEDTAPALGLRLADYARWIAMVLTATVAGMGAFVITASLEARPVGNAAVATSRLLALTALAGVAVLIDLGHWGVERFVELAIQIGGFILLASVWNRWPIKLSIRFVAITALIQLLVVAAAAFVAWAWLGSP